jgi:hypothetical protein
VVNEDGELRSFKNYLTEQRKKRQKSVSKKKHLLKHTVLIQAEEGDPIQGTKARLNVKSLHDCNIIGFVTFETYEDALSTYNRLTNLDEIVEYLQRNSQRFPTCADWAYIVRDEVDMREKLEPQMPQAPQAMVSDPEADEEDPEMEPEEPEDGEEEEEPQENIINEKPKIN